MQSQFIHTWYEHSRLNYYMRTCLLGESCFPRAHDEVLFFRINHAFQIFIRKWICNLLYHISYILLLRCIRVAGKFWLKGRVMNLFRLVHHACMYTYKLRSGLSFVYQKNPHRTRLLTSRSVSISWDVKPMLSMSYQFQKCSPFHYPSLVLYIISLLFQLKIANYTKPSSMYKIKQNYLVWFITLSFLLLLFFFLVFKAFLLFNSVWRKYPGFWLNYMTL